MTDWAMSTIRCTSSAVWHRPCPIVALEWINCGRQLRTGSSEHDARQRSAANVHPEDDEAYLAVQHHLEVPGAAAVLVESYTYVLPELHLQRFRQRIRVSVVHSNRSSAQLSVALAETEDLVLLNEGWRAACARLVASAAAELNGQSGERHRAGEI